MRKEHILITGGCGFIGSNMVGYQLAKGRDVWTVDNMITAKLRNLEPYLKNAAFHFDQADICSWPLLTDAVKWADRIFHFAASVGQKFVLNNPIYSFTNNVEGCKKLLEAMDSVGSHARFLLASSSEIYSHSMQNPDGTFIETAMVGVPSGNYLQQTYPVSKLSNEILTLSYAKEKGLHGTIARIFNTIGINQNSTYGMVVPTFIEQATHQKPLTIFGDGLQSRSFCDVRDTIQALDILLDHPESKGEIYNVGSDRECTITELAHLIMQRIHSHSEIRYLSYEEAYGVPFTDIRKRKPHLQKLKALTGYTPHWSLEDTLDFILEDQKRQAAS